MHASVEAIVVDAYAPVAKSRPDLRFVDGESIPLPRAMRNRFGYDLEFNRAGRLGHLQIDFDAVAEHLYELSRGARARRLDLALVDFAVKCRT